MIPVWLLPININVNACMVPDSHWLSRGLRTQPSALRRPAVLWRNLRALPRHTTRATSQMLFGKPCLHLFGAAFFGKQAAARGICVLRPRCACGAVGVKASLAPRSGSSCRYRVASVWRFSGFAAAVGAAELCGSAARAGDEQRSTRSGPPSATCGSHGEGVVSVATKAGQRHNLSCSVPGKFCIHFFPRLERGLHVV